MNNIIRLSAGGDISILDYPDGSDTYRKLARMISDDCRYVERVRPRRLYSVFRCCGHVDPKVPGRAVCMVVDEEFLLKHEAPEPNIIASWLYETDIHHNPILGDVLFVGERIGSDGGLDFCGLDESAGLALLCNLNTVSSKLKKMKQGGMKVAL